MHPPRGCSVRVYVPLCRNTQEWAEKMDAVGLGPSDTGKPGGNRTGESMTHFIIKDGAYAQAARKLLKGGFELSWVDRAGGTKRKKKKASSEESVGQISGQQAFELFARCFWEFYVVKDVVIESCCSLRRRHMDTNRPEQRFREPLSPSPSRRPSPCVLRG